MIIFLNNTYVSNLSHIFITYIKGFIKIYMYYNYQIMDLTT